MCCSVLLCVCGRCSTKNAVGGCYCCDFDQKKHMQSQRYGLQTHHIISYEQNKACMCDTSSSRIKTPQQKNRNLSIVKINIIFPLNLKLVQNRRRKSKQAI